MNRCGIQKSSAACACAGAPCPGDNSHGQPVGTLIDLPGCPGFPEHEPGKTQFSQIAFSDADRDTLAKALSSSPDPVAQFDAAVVSARAAAASLPPAVLNAIRTWMFSPGATGCLIVRNLPTDPTLPATPTHGQAAADKETFVSEGRLLTFGLLLGEPFGYAAERGGAIIHNSAPIPGKENSPSSSGARRLLEAHTEFTAGRFQRVAPELLLLTFLRGDPQAATLYADARAMYSRLTKRERAAARSVTFRTRIPESFSGNLGGGFSERIVSKPHPIFVGPEEDVEIIFDASATEAAGKDGRRVIRTIVDLLSDPEVFTPIVGGPGDLFLLNNRRGIHGRTAFAPLYNGTQRWPQRVYIISAGAIYDNRARFDPIRRIFTSIPLA